MRRILPQNLILLAESAPFPLYVVGGTVRDHLAGLTPKTPDFDICSPTSAEIFAEFATLRGFCVKSVFKNTGTVKLQDKDKTEYEYSCFRSDKYVRGTHVPVEIYFTDDIGLDARRRDFTANAVYYDIKADKYVDPLDGISAIRQKRLTTVAPAEKVFGEDGLRLMRLARQAATLGFYPDDECLLGAAQNAALIDDISPERVFAELSAILRADEKYGNADGSYQGLRLLEKTGVLARILPELAKGKGMAQRADFHKYDVLEHSLRAVKYAPPSIRLAALLHDVGKPLCTLRDGNSYNHPIEGEILAKTILHRLKAPKKTTETVCALVRWHMYDMDCKTGEAKLRRFFVEHYSILEDLLLLKQADFSACMDDRREAPTCTRWKNLLAQMKREGAPFALKDLDIKGTDLLALGIQPARVSAVLHKLLSHAVVLPQDNQKERLLKLAKCFENER